MPPLILLKSDGAVLYGTTDLATIVDRVREHDPDLILYVVDQRQHGHFEQVFRAAKKTGLAGRAELEHIGYGTVNGPDGKPFKTRAGGVMKLYDLIAMATEEATKRLNEQGLALDYPEEERAAVAKMVGVAAIKFADLAEQPRLELHLRSRTLHALRRQDRTLSAIRGRAHPIDPAQGGSRRLRGRRARHPLGRRTPARAAAPADARSAAERRSEARAPFRLRLRRSRSRRTSAASTPSTTS